MRSDIWLQKVEDLPIDVRVHVHAERPWATIHLGLWEHATTLYVSLDQLRDLVRHGEIALLESDYRAADADA